MPKAGKPLDTQFNHAEDVTFGKPLIGGGKLGSDFAISGGMSKNIEVFKRLEQKVRLKGGKSCGAPRGQVWFKVGWKGGSLNRRTRG